MFVVPGVGDFLNWMTLFGVGLIVGGAALITVAVKGAKDLQPARRHPPVTAAQRGPEIKPSALLADTIWVNQVTQAPEPIQR